MKVLYEKMVQLLKEGENFSLITIFNKTGSAPRTAGSKMIITEKGLAYGTIGGGLLEANSLTAARESLKIKHTFMMNFNLTGKDAEDMDMICGGEGEVLISFIDSKDENNLTVLEAIVDILKKKEKAWIITMLDNIPGSTYLKRQQCIVKSDGSLIGQIDCDAYMLEKIISGPAKISIHSEVVDNQRILAEPIRNSGTVYIFGAGHVSQKIAPLCESVGFRTVVLDDREDFASRERFSAPIELMVVDSYSKMPSLSINEESYLVIVTRGHLYDKIVLEQFLRSKAKYIGMIGSKSKREQIYKALMDNGYSKEELERVYSPIGTDIGAETPEEIAVSIVGQLIKVRAEAEKIKKEEK